MKVERGRKTVTQAGIMGTIYRITDSGKEYYYLIHILDPQDVYLVEGWKVPERERQEIHGTTIPTALLKKHQKVKEKPKQEEEDKTWEALEIEKDQALWEKNRGLSLEAVRFLRREFGEDFNAELEWMGSRVQFWIINGTHKFKFNKNFTDPSERYTIISLEEERNAHITLMEKQQKNPKPLEKSVNVLKNENSQKEKPLPY